MSESATQHARAVVPPLGHFLWIQNLADGGQWVTQTEQDGAAFFIRIDGHQVVCYGPFRRHAEFGCALSPVIRMDALPADEHPPGLGADTEVLSPGPLDPPAC